MLRRILIANRGEIAVRIIRACHELGIQAIAVYSDADVDTRHASLADGAIRIGPAPAAESYLALDAIISAARDSGAEAVHPGYGFLAEHHGFAQACADAGLVFIGPPASVIEQMGSKIAARRLAQRAGVPIVPGETPDDQSDAAVIAAAERVGFPLLLKPSEGGGGIGMKTVRDPAQLPAAVAQARREALASFGDGTLYIERLVERPRHVEIQVLADHHGNVVHVFERECSIQRRHQKVVEESPSMALTPQLRARMGVAAVALARAAGYRNAGTIEFLLEGTGNDARFYFLEMNTRLQVEHPVTEQVTGIDIVRAQIAVAGGERLPWTQDQLSQRGHAIEVRVYAEDPARDHLPQAGHLLLYREPSMPGVRIDSGVTEGAEVPVHYDPLVAKLIASAENRDAARRRAVAALREFPILGIRTNIPFLLELLEHPRFVSGDVDTTFLDVEGASLAARLRADAPPDALAVAEVHAGSRDSMATLGAAGDRGAAAMAKVRAAMDPWASLRGWRG